MATGTITDFDFMSTNELYNSLENEFMKAIGDVRQDRQDGLISPSDAAAILADLWDSFGNAGTPIRQHRICKEATFNSDLRRLKARYHNLLAADRTDEAEAARIEAMTLVQKHFEEQ